MTVRDRVDAITESLGPSYEWDERERGLLDLAARQADDLDRLEADIADCGIRVPDRGDQTRLHQAVAEARQARVALARILGQVDIPDSVSPASLHGRKAAQASWEVRGAA